MRRLAAHAAGQLVALARPFRDLLARRGGDCARRLQLRVDGHELIFEFGVGTTRQRIASCEVDIDWGHPLFVAVGIALGEWIARPLT